MLILRRQAYARAGLVGNPSDGYHGKTLSISLGNFRAEVVLYEWDELEIVWTEQDQSRFASIHHLAKDVKLHGYYGGLRLIKATIKKFVDYCTEQNHALHDRNFSIRYHSDIPRQVGLAGSSAIIVATLRCLIDFYEVPIPLEIQPSLALAVEKDELRITAGLQDRVIQVYGGLVYMDFARTQKQGGLEHGTYERLAPSLLPPLYVAYSVEQGEPTEVFHNDIRGRYDRGDADVHRAMKRCAELADEARNALIQGDRARLGQLIDENFEQRRSIYKLPTGQVAMVEVARKAGASAHFAGSGGAIVGTYDGEEMYARLERNLSAIHCRVIKPLS